MKKKTIFIISIILISMVISCFALKVNATGLDALTNPDAYIQSSGDSTAAIPIGNTIIWVVRTIGEAIAVIMLLVVGIKYILGSVEEKAEYKQSMWPYILGAILIFTGAALTGVIYNAFNG